MIRPLEREKLVDLSRALCDGDGSWEIESVNIGRRDRRPTFLRGLGKIKLIGGAFLRSIGARESNRRRDGIISRPTARVPSRFIVHARYPHGETRARGFTRISLSLRENSRSSRLRDYQRSEIFYHAVYIVFIDSETNNEQLAHSRAYDCDVGSA